MHVESDTKKTTKTTKKRAVQIAVQIVSRIQAAKQNLRTMQAAEVPYETSERVLIAAASSQSTMQRKG